jgi:O-antigen/teichoic acid export membrane protein
MDILKSYTRIKTLVSQFTLKDGLRSKAVRGGAWLGGGSVAEQTIRLARNMLLARMLAPGAFGTMSIVVSLGSLVASFSDVGIGPAIIQNPRGGTAEYLNAAWWLGMARAIFMYGAVFVAAPSIAGFYGIADLTALLRVALLSLILDGMLSPRTKLVQKEMQFGRWAFVTNGGGICGVALTIGLSFVIRDVWALAIGYCCENGFRLVFSYIVCPGLPSFRWDKRAFKDLLNFSRGIFGLSFLNLLFARTDIFVLGKLFSPEALGIYALTVNLIQAPMGFLINMLSQILQPAFSHVQSDIERLNRIFSEATSWLVFLGLPVVTTIWLCGSSLLTVVYGHRYGDIAATEALGFAAGVAFLNTLNAMITLVFYATGRPGLHRRAVAASSIIMVIVIYPACKYLGLPGGQVAALIAIAASYLLQLSRMKRITDLNLTGYGKAFIPAVLGSAGILVAGAAAHLLGLTVNPSANIAIAAGACLLAYAGCLRFFMRITRKMHGAIVPELR